MITTSFEDCQTQDKHANYPKEILLSIESEQPYIDTNKIVRRTEELPYIHEGDYPKAFLIVVTVRLGIQKIDSEYFESITKCFEYPQCVGIIGGKPNFALYFVGH